MLLEYHGINDISEAELRRILKTKPKGTNLFNLLFLRDEKRWNLDVEISVGRPDELYTNIASYKIPIIPRFSQSLGQGTQLYGRHQKEKG
jgi:hypothetical protein